MTSGSGVDAEPFAEYAKRFVLASWRVSRETGAGRTADLRGHQQRLFTLLTATVQARLHCAASFPEIDGALRRLTAQAMRFVMCDPGDCRRAHLLAQRLGERAFPLLHRFDDGPNPQRLALPPPGSARNVIRIDFRARRRC